MTEPSVETAEGREFLRNACDRRDGYGHADWTWAATWLRASLRALDARDKHVASLSEMTRLLEQRIAALEAQLTEARAAAIEECAKVADSFTCGLCGMDGKPAAAIRALRDPGA